MPTTVPTRVRATVDVWGAGPGMGGSSYIEFVFAAGEWQVFGGGSATERRDQLGTVTAGAGWRERVAFIVHDAPPAHEEHSPSEVTVTGAAGLEAALLRMAWCGPDGSSAVQALLQLDDSEVDAAICRSGEDLDLCLASVHQLIDQLGEDIALSLIRKGVAAEEFSWEAVVEHATRVVDAREAEEAAAAGDASVALQPFKERIDQMLSNWWRVAGGASSSATQMMMSAKRGAIKRYCENYALANGAIPVGSHTVAFAAFGRNISISVDFDQLLTKQP